ncbi:Peroxidase [Melia azedarach]|uniref:Peroxidase n=1 Tax=Melia azedarach TaxID=155640 RepID=A0ACC1YFJ6_MELAZ|nr:Peroxidase [Melia azedarach]
MRAARNSLFLFLVSLLVFGVVSRVSDAKPYPRPHPHPRPQPQPQGLTMNFYSESCKNAEDIVRKITRSRVRDNQALAAKLLRTHYHDCFVRGCDASILLDTVDNTTQSEKEARPNLTLEGFDVIDEIKSEIEKVCPETVSCSDILALAARDAVSFPRRQPLWEVPTGRRDGFVSLASEVPGNIPSPFSNFSTLLQIFRKKGMDINDLAVLSGAHTIGVAHCGTFSRRLFNFTGNGDADPSLDATYAESLKVQCPNPANPATTVEMDPQSSLSFDSHYYKIVLQHKGLFQSDAALLTDGNSANIVSQLQNPRVFFREFAESVKKMGAVEVLTGNAGEIRKQCRVVNPK